MLKHNGVYWYWKDGEWHQVERVKPRVRRGPWPVGYQRTSCAVCRHSLKKRGQIVSVDGFHCSAKCLAKSQEPRDVACPSCGAVSLSKRYGRYCSAECRDAHLNRKPLP